jgi:ribosomal-protein-alanine N-acetyltransferase
MPDLPPSREGADLAITPMRSEDIEAIVAIEQASPGSSTWDAEGLAGELTRSWAHLWVARVPSGEAIAFVATWLVADELHVLNVATHPSHRRRGVARRLIETALGFARERAVRHLLLEVRRSNEPAIRLYRAFGFFAMGLRARYYADDEDAIEMVLRLDERGAVVACPDEVSLGSA